MTKQVVKNLSILGEGVLKVIIEKILILKIFSMHFSDKEPSGEVAFKDSISIEEDPKDRDNNNNKMVWEHLFSYCLYY